MIKLEQQIKLGRVFMKFLKENSYDILRLYINQIGITIFSLVLYFSVGMLDDKVLSLRLKIAISVFAMLFFFALLYTAAWDWGAKDKGQLHRASPPPRGREHEAFQKEAFQCFLGGGR